MPMEIHHFTLGFGADVNAMNHRGSTALHICCFLATTNEKQESDGVIVSSSLTKDNKETKDDMSNK
eukprot:1506193-Ditylum_brightwellii.AAC.1